MNSRLQRSLPEQEEEFRGRYWLKSELMDLARSLGLSAGGSKGELLDSIAGLIYHGKRIPSPVKKDPRPAAGGKLTLESLIETPYRSDERHRALFQEVLGPGFKFTVPFMNWMKEHQGQKTYSDALETYGRLQEEKKQGVSREIGSQFEYNRYTREFFRQNPGLSREDCIRCWNHKKAQTGSHAYGPEDLNILSLPAGREDGEPRA